MGINLIAMLWYTFILLLGLPQLSHAKKSTVEAKPKAFPKFNSSAEALQFFNSSMKLYAAKDDDEWERRVSAFTSEKKDIKVFLDHGGVTFHGEVFYSVANRISELLPLHDVTFYVHENFAQASGIGAFWGKYAKTGPIRDLKYKIVTLYNYTSLDHACNRESILSGPFFLKTAGKKVVDRVHMDLHVQVTIHDHKSFGCLPLYVDDPRYVMIMHHAETGTLHYKLSQFRNVFIASGSAAVKLITENHFTPSLMPMRPNPPNCDKPPLFMVQGSIGRRNLTELKVLFDMEPREKFHVSVRSKTALTAEWFMTDDRGDFLQHTNMTTFHESFKGAAFILPLIPGAGDGDPRGYLHNHPTSSIAYAANFGMRIVGHKNIPVAYPETLEWRIGHYHDNSLESVRHAYREAILAFKEFCKYKKEVEDSGKVVDNEKLINLWVYGFLDSPVTSEHIPVAWEGPYSIFVLRNQSLATNT